MRWMLRRHSARSMSGCVVQAPREGLDDLLPRQAIAARAAHGEDEGPAEARVVVRVQLLQARELLRRAVREAGTGSARSWTRRSGPAPPSPCRRVPGGRGSGRAARRARPRARRSPSHASASRGSGSRLRDAGEGASRDPRRVLVDAVQQRDEGVSPAASSAARDREGEGGSCWRRGAHRMLSDSAPHEGLVRIERMRGAPVAGDVDAAADPDTVVLLRRDRGNAAARASGPAGRAGGNACRCSSSWATSAPSA